MPECCWVEYCPAVMTVETAGLILLLDSNSLDPATWFLMLKQPQSPVCCSKGCIPLSLPEKQVLCKHRVLQVLIHTGILFTLNLCSSVIFFLPFYAQYKKIFIFSEIRGITSKMAVARRLNKTKNWRLKMPHKNLPILGVHPVFWKKLNELCLSAVSMKATASCSTDWEYRFPRFSSHSVLEQGIESCRFVLAGSRYRAVGEGVDTYICLFSVLSEDISALLLSALCDSWSRSWYYTSVYWSVGIMTSHVYF